MTQPKSKLSRHIQNSIIDCQQTIEHPRTQTINITDADGNTVLSFAIGSRGVIDTKNCTLIAQKSTEREITYQFQIASNKETQSSEASSNMS